MAYKKQNFQDGQVLKAEHLNNIENGVVVNERYYGLKHKKVSFIGDSITTFQGWVPEGYAYYYPRYDIQDVEQTWWKQLINITGMELVKNCAWSGSSLTGNAASTESAAAGCSTKRINDLADGTTVPDIIIILLTINDFATGKLIGDWDGRLLPEDTTSVTTISEGYALMLSKILKTYPLAEVFCCTVLEAPNQNGYDDTPGVFPTDFKNANSDAFTTVHQYNDCIRRIASTFGVKVIEMHQCGIHYFNGSHYLADGLHPNAKGARLMTKKALSELENKSRFCHFLEDEMLIDPESVPTGTWYVDVASRSSFSGTSVTSSAAFAYSSDAQINACIGKPINALRLAVANEGTLTYGKNNGTTHEVLGTINLTLPSKRLQIYEIPEITLAAGERLWFQASGDTGLFYFGATSAIDKGVGPFNSGVKASGQNSYINDLNLSVDIGYFTQEEFDKYEEWLNQ